MSRRPGRTPPHDLEAEASLLGAALIRQQVVDNLKGTVDPSDFYKSQHQTIWQAMLDMHEVGYPIDVVSVGGEVKAHGIDTSDLWDCVNACPAVSAAGRYADLIVEASRRRKLLAHLSDLADRCYTDTADSVLHDIDPGGDHLIADRGGVVRGFSRLDQFVAAANIVEEQGEWLVPHIMRPRWRIVLVATEGIGKGTLMRHIGLHAAAGRDPWHPTRRIVPRSVLYVDAENPNTTILHQIRISNLDHDMAEEASETYFIWHREGGINLRDRRIRAEFERVLQHCRPEIVFAGPFYKLFRRRGAEDLEQATLEFVEVIDDFRVRFNFALMLEAHAPKGQGGSRDLNPRGSAVLMGWPEFGITIEPVGNPTMTDTMMTVELGRFRRDRERADWPSELLRGQMGQRTAWSARWGQGRNRQGFPFWTVD